MKNVKLIFGIASIALLMAVGCFLAFLFLPGDSENQGKDAGEEQDVAASLSIEEQAEIEIERFKSEYGLEITMEDMVTQLKVREQYEETYQKTYPLEDVFLVKEDTDDSVGDSGDTSYTDTIEKIQMYVKKYNIDESRYASMTAEEQLHALEVEYGMLESENAEDERDAIEKEAVKEEGLDADP